MSEGRRQLLGPGVPFKGKRRAVSDSALPSHWVADPDPDPDPDPEKIPRGSHASKQGLFGQLDHFAGSARTSSRDRDRDRVRDRAGRQRRCSKLDQSPG